MEGVKRMVNKEELKYKMEIIIKYLKEHSGYEYKLYNRICPDYGEPDSNIVEYAEDVKKIIDILLESIKNIKN